MQLEQLCLQLVQNSANKAEKLGESDNKMEQPKGADNVVYKWGRIALDGTAFDTERFKPRPTITSRFLGLVMTSMFDTWTRFDEKANQLSPKELKGFLKQCAP